MIEISPLRDKKQLEKLYLNEKARMNELSTAVVAKDNNEVLGYCLFDQNNDCLVIHALAPADDLLMADGILRAALHVGVENGISKAFYSENAPFGIFDKLEFIKNAEIRELSVDKLFSSCKNCPNI